MKLVIVGSGYVGLVAGACLAECGHNIVCVDTDKNKIKRLNRGIVPIYEPGLSELIHAHVKQQQLSFTTDLKSALEDADAAFIAVGTPPRATDGHADMCFVHEAAKSIAENASGDLVVINKSTVPVGTGDDVERILRNTNINYHFSVVSNPEFLREGAAIEDFLRPDRIVIGAEDEWAKTVVTDIYGVEGFKDAPVVLTSRRSAELIKYAANAYLALKITFINEVSDLCEVAGANVRDVAHGMGLDNRIGPKFLNAGPGYGGSCFPKDTLALAKTARDHRVELRVVETVIHVNENRKRAMALKILDACDGNVRGKKIAMLGLAFKANTDDMRDAPSLSIIQALQDFGAEVYAYDPASMENARTLAPGVKLCASAYEAIDNADVTVIVTEWDEFKSLDLNQIRSIVKTPIIVDLRNIHQETEMIAAGIIYHSIGKKHSTATPDTTIATLAVE
jgi:UDPglucose 6-dehydrogenase